MKNAFASALWAAVTFGIVVAAVLHHPPQEAADIEVALFFVVIPLIWLAVSVTVFWWRFREWRSSRFVNFIIFR
jgi:membrane protein DedA with SNARE-associated domain